MQNSTITVRREILGTAYWVHVTGPTQQMHRASIKAGAEARKWTKELGKLRAFRISSGGDLNQIPGQFRYSVCYSFTDTTTPPEDL